MGQNIKGSNAQSSFCKAGNNLIVKPDKDTTKPENNFLDGHGHSKICANHINNTLQISCMRVSSVSSTDTALQG
jgi:hypothetical protein